MASKTDINIRIKAFDEASAALGTAGSNVEKLAASIEKHQAKFAIGAAAILGGMAAMTVGAREQRRTQLLLDNSMASVGESYATQRVELEGLIATMQHKTGVSDEEQREALGFLIATTGSYETALAALPAAIDVAALRGKSLSRVVQSMGPVIGGVTNQLISLGINFDKNATAQERIDIIMARVGGTAEAQADQLKILSADWADLSDEVGEILLPILDSVAAMISEVVVWFNELSDRTQKVFVALGLVTGGLLALLAVFPVALKAFAAMRVAIAALSGPLGIVYLAVGALAAVFVSTLLPDMDEVGDSADDLGGELDETKKSIDNMATASTRAATEMVAVATGMDALSAGMAKAVNDMDAIVEESFLLRGFAPATEEQAAAALDVLGLLPAQLGAIFDKTSNVGQVWIDSVDNVASRLERLSPEVRDAFLAAGSEAVRILGITASDIANSGKTIHELITEAYAGASDEVKNELAETARVVEFNMSTIGDNWEEIVGRHIEDTNAAGEAIGTGLVVPTEEGAADIATAMETARTQTKLSLDDVLDFLRREWTAAESLIFDPVAKGSAGALKAVNDFATGAEAALAAILAALEGGQNAANSAGASGGGALGGGGFGGDSSISGGFEGGPGHAFGTSFFRGGLTMVGERGEELVELPQGSRIHNADETRQMMTGGNEATTIGGLRDAGRERAPMLNYGTYMVVLPNVHNMAQLTDEMDALGQA